YGKVYKAFLTLKNNFLIANAGIDSSNAREGEVALWPKNPQETAEKIMKELSKRTGKRVAVVVVDSRTVPLRRGTIGLALGVAGFRPVKDYRKRKDLFGKPLQITLQNLADDLACAAHLLMGEANEGVPIVLARGAPVELDHDANANVAFIRPEECLYMKVLKTLG
ncbi:TPA: cytidine deaminase, partial [Candidatus Bathyarchaeota archaeon]|nr:cytidine deaminase [Candidatus Bathyarchaeota archaeon]